MSLNSNALTTADRLIQFAELGTLSSAETSLLESLINSVSDFVENYCARTFKLTTHTNELLDGDNSDGLALDHHPITTFTKLEERTGSNSWSSIGSDLYVVNKETGIVYIDSINTFRSINRGSRFVQGRLNYRATYTAGYDFDNTADPVKTLESVGLGDLEYAVWKLANTAWNQRKGDSNVQSERLGDYSVTFRKVAHMDQEVVSILNNYENVVG